MAKPEREFSADVGQKSMGVAGPDYIEKDFDKAFAMFDPDKNLPDGTTGGIGKENMQPGAVDDDVIGNREVDDTQSPTGNIGKLSNFLNWFAYMIKSITGKANWRTKPATTLDAAKTHIDAAAPHSGHETPAGAQAKVDTHEAKTNNPHSVSATQTGALVSVDGVSNSGGNIDLVAGSGVKITPDTTNKRITIAAVNESIIPGAHAETHSSEGDDSITPASIGAETPSGAQSKVNTHEAKAAPHSGHETLTGAQAKVDALKTQIVNGTVMAKRAARASYAKAIEIDDYEGIQPLQMLVTYIAHDEIILNTEEWTTLVKYPIAVTPGRKVEIRCSGYYFESAGNTDAQIQIASNVIGLSGSQPLQINLKPEGTYVYKHEEVIGSTQGENILYGTVDLLMKSLDAEYPGTLKPGDTIWFEIEVKPIVL